MKEQAGKFTIDTIITVITRALQLGLSLVISIIIARVLGPEGQGIYSLAIFLPSLLINFGNFGFGQASVFYVGRQRYPVEEIFGNNIILSFLLGIITFLVGLGIIIFFGNYLFPKVAKIYLFLALFLIPLRFFLSFINYLLLGLQRIKEFNFINILQSFVFLTLLSVVLLVFKFAVKATIVANILACLIGAIVLFYLAKKIVGNFYLSFNKFYLKEAFQYGFKVYLGNVIGFLHYRIDIFLINILLNPMAVGFYSIATALAEKIWFVSQSAGIVLFPRVSTETNERNLKEFTPIVCRNVLLITLVSAILLFCLGRSVVVLFYSEKFLDSVLPFQILLMGTVTMSGWRILANDLYGRGKPELNIYVSLASVLLNIILNILWIPRHGIVGAAWATSISYVFAFIIIMVIYSKISRNSIEKVMFLRKSDIIVYYDFIVSFKERIKAYVTGINL